jgi:hypothetical protein
MAGSSAIPRAARRIQSGTNRVAGMSTPTSPYSSAQLCWQQAAENYAPDGCHASTGTRARVV